MAKKKPTTEESSAITSGDEFFDSVDTYRAGAGIRRTHRRLDDVRCLF
jgi:hypothetical protein